MKNTTFIILSLLVITQSLLAQTGLKKTEILVLGTPHLSQISGFHQEMLDELVLKLDEYKFDAICIENMPGELLYDIQSRQDSAFIDLLHGYGSTRLGIADSAQVFYGVNFLEAQQQATKLLNQEDLTDKDRLKLIRFFSASTDLASATLQYSYLSQRPERPTDRFEERLFHMLEENWNSSDEIYSLACRLAHKRRINKLEYIDNLQDEPSLLKFFPTFMQDFMDHQDLFKDLPNLPVYVEMSNQMKEGVEKNNLLGYYQYLNSRAYMSGDYEAQWAIWLGTNFSSGSDRARYSLWEMRNLQIAANIIKTAAFYPGERILVIIGSAHKSFIEKYLQQIQDVELLEFK